MNYYLERLNSELTGILDFWKQNMISGDSVSILPEYNESKSIKSDITTGSMYLGRVIYGASAACRFKKDTKYKVLADIAFKNLYEQFRNPAGGFYWAKTQNNKVVHDSSNVNMAQAFVLYGLSEYFFLTKNPVVESELKKQYQFIIKTLRDTERGGYLDGFSSDWKQEKTFTKSLGTHLHLMEAFSKVYQCTGDKQIINDINELLDIITEKFIDKKNMECIHQLETNWTLMLNTNWAGHNAEVSWIIHQTAMHINDRHKAELTGQLAVDMTNKVLEMAFDKNYGGIFNTLIDGKTIKENKEWWPQAETVIACLNAYQISKDKVFLSYGLRLLEYIENTFSDSRNGEWYSSVSKEGTPINSVPKIHFWKSLYHNVRYCIESYQRIENIIEMSRT